VRQLRWRTQLLGQSRPFERNCSRPVALHRGLCPLLALRFRPFGRRVAVIPRRGNPLFSHPRFLHCVQDLRGQSRSSATLLLNSPLELKAAKRRRPPFYFERYLSVCPIGKP